GIVSDACVIALGAVSALGVGHAAYAIDPPGEPVRVGLARDRVLVDAGLQRPLAGRAPPEALATIDRFASRDRATALLDAALSQTLARLDEVRPRWRSERIGVAIGTSSGGMLSAERFFARRAGALQGGHLDEPDAERSVIARAATYFAPLSDALAA